MIPSIRYYYKNVHPTVIHSIHEHYAIILKTLIFISFLFACWICYPGLISDDTATQYLEASHRAPLSDWHSPFMTLFWRFEIFVFHTPNLLDATFIGLFTFGLYLFLKQKNSANSLLLFLIIFFSPPALIADSYLYSDIPLAHLLLISAAILFLVCRKQKSSKRKMYFLQIPATILLIFCCLLRINGSFAAIPLILALWYPWRFNLQHLLLCFFSVLISIPTVGFINHHIFHAKNDHAEKSLQIFDLGGIAYHSYTHPNGMSHWEQDCETFQNWRFATFENKLMACYDPTRWDTYGSWMLEKYPYKDGSWHGGWNKWGDIEKSNHCIEFGDYLRSFDLGDYAHNAEPGRLWKQWSTAIISRPISYFKHRVTHFTTDFLGNRMTVPRWDVFGYHHIGETDQALERVYNKKTPARQIIQFIHAHDNLIFYYGAFWLCSALSLFILSLKGEAQINSFLNVTSFASICYFMGYLFVSVGNEARYLLPSAALVIAAALGIYISGEKAGTPLSRRIGLDLWIISLVTILLLKTLNIIT